MFSSGFSDWQLGVYCCEHVFRGERRVLLVARNDGDWQFLCGDVDHPDTSEPYHVCVGHLLDQDATLHELADLPPEWEAERTSTASPWIRTACDPN